MGEAAGERPVNSTPCSNPQPSPTLEDLLRRTTARRGDQTALIDPIDKQRVTGTRPRTLTYAETDRAVSAIATHFIDSGLSTGTVIALQLPNTIELSLTVLAAFRAGLVVALLPQLWRQADLATALNRIGARAIVTASRIDGVSHADIAMQAAADVFSIRNVFGFGDHLPEGMAGLDDVIARPPSPALFPAIDPRRLALITFDVTADGLRSIPRSHMSLMAAGLAIVLESRLPQGARLLSTMAPASLAGLGCSTVAWLLSGGTLSLHHAFDADALAAQLKQDRCNALAVPTPLAFRLEESGALRDLDPACEIIGLWRSPEQADASGEWKGAGRLTDVYLFGEAGLFGLRRGEAGSLIAITAGQLRAPHDIPGATVVSELLLTPQNTLALRGPMVPVAAYAPPAQQDWPMALSSSPKVDSVDTGYAARRDHATGKLRITAPPAGVVAVGGYRFVAEELQQWAKRLSQGAVLTALPDRLNGQRIAGRAGDNARAREALAELGLNPLMSEAFRGGSL